MEQETICPEMEELRQLVIEAYPVLSNNHQNFVLEVLWAMLATAMRATSTNYEGIKLSDLLQPCIFFFLVSTGLPPDSVAILEKFLFGKERKLPFGTITVDINGIVTLIEVKN